MDDNERERVRRSMAEYEATIDPAEAPGRMDLFRPFGPLLARIAVPIALVDRINRHVDEYLSAHGDAPAEDQEPRIGTFDLDAEFMTSGGETAPSRYFAELIARYVTECESLHGGQVEFERFWIVRHIAGSFSPVHFHSTDVAGVLYLKVPPAIATPLEEAGKSYMTARKAGNLTYIHGGRQSYSRSFVSFKPVVGELLLAPGWLLHAVEPFSGSGERRSLAFNASIR